MGGQTVACLLSMALIAAAGPGGMDEDMAELAKMVRETCQEESGVDLGLVEQVNDGADLTPDSKLKCYIKCTMETGGVMSDGVVDVDALMEILPQEFIQKVGAVLKKCGTQTGADDCDTAYLTQLCWQKANKPAYFLI